MDIHTHIFTHTYVCIHTYTTVRDDVESSEEAQPEQSQGAIEQSHNASLHQNDQNIVHNAHGRIDASRLTALDCENIINKANAEIDESRLADLDREKNLGICTRRRTAVKREEHPGRDLRGDESDEEVLWEWTNTSMVGGVHDDERVAKRHKFVYAHDDGIDLSSSRYDLSALAEKNRRGMQDEKSECVQGRSASSRPDCATLAEKNQRDVLGEKSECM
jgi:hypothetical protein